jgi:RNA polymerase sigma-70 factor (ECF subfamily)
VLFGGCSVYGPDEDKESTPMTTMTLRPTGFLTRRVGPARPQFEEFADRSVSETPLTPAAREQRMQALYDAHSGALFGSLLRWTAGDRQAAEDLVQETMLRAWRNLDSLRGDPARLRPWLLTVARRLAIDALRARAARPPEAEVDPLERMAGRGESYEQVLNRQLVIEGLSGLSPDHRAALMHVYILDQTVPQAARSLGVPEGTIKSRVHHALRAIRSAFDDATLGY